MALITMSNTPPPTDEDHTTANRKGYVLPRSNYNVAPPERGVNPAADVIRDKLSKIYAAEPDPFEEEKEAEAVQARSKHQQFMYDLNHSGKDLAQIQTEWHNYYLDLSDQEKHQVWQEFYESNQVAHQPAIQLPADAPTEAEKLASVRNELATHKSPPAHRTKDRRNTEAVQSDIRSHAAKPGRLKAKQHLQSLAFGIGMGLLAVIIFLFGFFNEVIIAPFIQPARTATGTPLIVTADSIAPTSTPEVIIPKINVQIPVDFSETSTDEATIENDLESGVVHYPTTSMPGQNGNAAFFGHSSNNIFNKGKYKFAFVLLHELVPGDTFYITDNGKVYAYKVFSKTIVDPSDVGVLNPVAGHAATATLITCDPPGTSLHRLVVVGDQISPDPNGNGAATTASASASSSATELVGNGQTLWGHFISQGYGKAVVGGVVVVVVAVGFRRLSRR